MILESDDLIGWIADRRQMLVSAWTPELLSATDHDVVVASALALELHEKMTHALLRRGTEQMFARLVRQSGIGMEGSAWKGAVDRFYSVNVKLAREACRALRESRVVGALPYRRSTVVGDDRTNPDHRWFAGIILPHDHWFWKKWHPPFDMECRCGTILMTRSQFERSNRAINSESDIRERDGHLVRGWPPAFEPILSEIAEIRHRS